MYNGWRYTANQRSAFPLSFTLWLNTNNEIGLRNPTSENFRKNLFNWLWNFDFSKNLNLCFKSFESCSIVRAPPTSNIWFKFWYFIELNRFQNVIFFFLGWKFILIKVHKDFRQDFRAEIFKKLNIGSGEEFGVVKDGDRGSNPHFYLDQK